MKFIVVRKGQNGINFPVINKQGDVEFFDSEADADIERINLQPDYDELLKVYAPFKI